MKKKKTKKKTLRKRILKFLALFILVIASLFFAFFGSVYFGFWGKVENIADIKNIEQAEASIILDKNQKIIDKVYKFDRQSIDFKEFPQHLIDALVATEDARFYEHDGIDNLSLLRVFFKTILAGDKSSGGGSTITLQLAKNLYGRKNYGIFSMPVNKLKESIVAKRIESVYSKEDILKMYLNTVPFSGNTHGIESASRKFFSKPTSELNLSEAATLVGTLKANHSYNPRLFPERSQLRRDVVITQMLKYGYVSNEKANQAMSNKIDLDFSKAESYKDIYFVELIKSRVQKILDSIEKSSGNSYSLYEDGLVIHTTLDLKQQQILEQSIQNHLSELQPQFEEEYASSAPWNKQSFILEKAKETKYYQKLKQENLSESQILDSLKKQRQIEIFDGTQFIVRKQSKIDSLKQSLKQLNASSLSVNPKTGGILAYVGGRDYRISKYDFIKNAKRQVGSTFKPIVYAEALESGIQACDYFSAKAVTYTDQNNWSPKNSSEQEDPHLNYSFKAALTNSLNTVSVKVLESTGIQSTIEMAESMGVSSDLVEKPSLALGVSDMNIKELAKVYASFLNQGNVPKLYFINKITDKNGKVLVEFKPETTSKSNLSDANNRLILALLENVVNEGTAKRIRSTYGLTQDIAGKTGTTQNNKDGWFAAVTPKLVNITWVGHNSQIGFKSTRLGQGANSALPIFANMYREMSQDNSFDDITKSKFPDLSQKQKAQLDCEDVKRDGFFKRIFGKDKVEKEFEDEDENKDKPGFFNRLFGKKK
ncbi:transglycosylase domain-containing protein [Psychroflexus aestuariivivens]|uniref:transglycosylase domain-containing protein n=1 Tax=Psychroflexus aestuariivivens TaxID=1795040 RepID=UPI000FD82E21|nr:transglycosylase domain-containing protein [Psychroflexus aestuariivivens]